MRIIGMMLMMLIASVATADERPGYFGNSKAAGLEKCVEPTADMRRNHMVYLDNHRDDTVIRGIRTTDHSLKNCVDCHASSDADGKAIPVDAEGQFCGACHQKVAAQLDCFQCHSTKPQPADKQAGFTLLPGAHLSLSNAISGHLGKVQ